MDRKTKHRILGILVVIGLIIILLPFFQSKTELPSETTLVKAPPFPDQATQMTTEVSDNNNNVAAINTVNPVQPRETAVNQQPDDTINPNRSTLNLAQEAPALVQPGAKQVVANEPQPLSNVTNSPASSKPPVVPSAPAKELLTDNETGQMKTENNPQPSIPNEATSEKADSEKKMDIKAYPPHKKEKLPYHFNKPKKIAQKKSFEKIKLATDSTALDNNGLVKLKNPAWVIQLGSFKNKANALRLVNRLRASGYRAFIQEFSFAGANNNTRVFVGPEPKQTSARDLANEIELNMHIRGIIVSYKPLTL